jgi:hypothetical protein
MKYLKVEAGVRYWEDATVNGQEDTNGELIPFRNGDIWEPIIDLENGLIVDWPNGTVANIHYKVCDAGEYWLLDDNMNKVSKYKGHYVPDALLCYGELGYGDYIIMTIDENGKIQDFQKPKIEKYEWNEKTN